MGEGSCSSVVLMAEYYLQQCLWMMTPAISQTIHLRMRKTKMGLKRDRLALTDGNGGFFGRVTNQIRQGDGPDRLSRQPRSKEGHGDSQQYRGNPSRPIRGGHCSSRRSAAGWSGSGPRSSAKGQCRLLADRPS